VSSWEHPRGIRICGTVQQSHKSDNQNQIKQWNTNSESIFEHKSATFINVRTKFDWPHQSDGIRKAKQTFNSQPAGQEKDQDLDGGNVFEQVLRREELRNGMKHLEIQVEIKRLNSFRKRRSTSDWVPTKKKKENMKLVHRQVGEYMKFRRKPDR
jgi:hypothetical protein